MKLFALLTFSLFVGCYCESDALNKKPFKIQLELKKDNFLDYIRKSMNIHESALQNLGKADLGQEINTKVSHTADAINQYIETLHSQVTPLTQELLAKLSQEAEQLKARVEKDLDAMKTHLGPYAEEIRLEMERQVEELRKDVRPHREMLQSGEARSTLLQTAEEMKGGLEKSVAELQAQLEAEANEVKRTMDRYLQGLRESTVPVVENLKSQMTEAGQTFQQTFVSFGTELGENLKNQFIAFFQSLNKSS
ncbi:apolipoprotein A-IV-like [Sardina pilchardus]|uniref:apolipoprotein A-IV-like n=1 Tax=Sardina pilchardus TaxID=27697 RepID=UPI002E0ECBF7